MRAVLMRRRAAVLGGLLLLAGCGGLPRPFEGAPGKRAMKLSQPPPSRLAVPAPTRALLPDAASADYAKALVDLLVEREVPAVAEAGRQGDWILTVAAELRDGKVVPGFTVTDPFGKVRGSVDGTPQDPDLWAAGAAAELRRSAAADVASVAALLTKIEAARQQNDPDSLVNRPARILVREVTGAPGDGNDRLTREMRANLPKLGEMVQDSAEGADYIVDCNVTVADGDKGGQRIEIQWIVTDPRGHELGKVVQLNDIEPGSLDHYWGDVAVVVAQQAADGVRDVIQNQIPGRKPAVSK